MELDVGLSRVSVLHWIARVGVVRLGHLEKDHGLRGDTCSEMLPWSWSLPRSVDT